jgi:hypothetical protein
MMTSSYGFRPSSPFQSQFLKFHDAIKTIDTEENALLRDKRDAVLQRMRDRSLRFDFFNQGSYAMGTGCVPVRADFDIDVGIVFSGPLSERPTDPRTVKRWVRDAVTGHTQTIEWRRNCVRVQYTRQGSELYHVDLAVYWKAPPEDTLFGTRTSEQMWLAVGKEFSGPSECRWDATEPKELLKLVTSHLSGEDRMQFRRVIRYLKRWKDLAFGAGGNGAPVGVGLTLAALRWFRPTATYGQVTPLQYDDLAATLDLVRQMRGNFQHVIHDSEWVRRLAVVMSVKPGRDVFARMSNAQMRTFDDRLATLEADLASAQQARDSRPLLKAFGSDFPHS